MFINHSFRPLALLFFSGFGLINAHLRAQDGYKLTNTIALQGDGKWDYIKADEDRTRLFVSHFDRVHVIDLGKGKEIKSINNLNGVHGIALAPALNRGFISNGKNNTVSVFNYTTLDSITTVQLEGEKADAILYDSFSKSVWIFCGKSNNAIVMDAASAKVISAVPVGKAPEFAVSDNKGFIYDNSEEDNTVVVIDAVSKKMLRSFTLEDKAAPTGLAIDISNNRLFVACAETKKLAVVDASTGKIITYLPISGKVDAVAFDIERKLIFCSGGDGVTTVIKQNTKDSYQLQDNIITQTGAKTMAVDNRSHKLYFSVADYLGNTKELKPYSFKVLEYSR